MTSNWRHSALKSLIFIVYYVRLFYERQIMWPTFGLFLKAKEIRKINDKNIEKSPWWSYLPSLVSSTGHLLVNWINLPYNWLPMFFTTKTLPCLQLLPDLLSHSSFTNPACSHTFLALLWRTLFTCQQKSVTAYFFFDTNTFLKSFEFSVIRPN